VPPPPSPAPPPACSFTITPEVEQFSTEGGAGTIQVTTQSECAWTASTTESWIRLSESTGKGPGQSRYTVETNDAGARTGTITIGGRTVRVEQGGAGKHVSLNGTASSPSGSCPVLTFVVKGRTVLTDEQTQFKNGCDAVRAGVKVHIDGEERGADVYARSIEVQ